MQFSLLIFIAQDEMYEGKKTKRHLNDSLYILAKLFFLLHHTLTGIHTHTHIPCGLIFSLSYYCFVKKNFVVQVRRDILMEWNVKKKIKKKLCICRYLNHHNECKRALVHATYEAIRNNRSTYLAAYQKTKILFAISLFPTSWHLFLDNQILSVDDMVVCDF